MSEVILTGGKELCYWWLRAFKSKRATGLEDKWGQKSIYMPNYSNIHFSKVSQICFSAFFVFFTLLLLSAWSLSLEFSPLDQTDTHTLTHTHALGSFGEFLGLNRSPLGEVQHAWQGRTNLSYCGALAVAAESHGWGMCVSGIPQGGRRGPSEGEVN